MTRRARIGVWAVAAVIAALGGSGGAAALVIAPIMPATGPVAATKLVVVGVPGLRWDDVSVAATPTLWALAGQSAIGALSVKAADPVSCPPDGWLTLGAGNRATADAGRACGSPGPAVDATGTGATVADFTSLARRNRDRPDATRLGALADALSSAGRCAAAAGPGAALAAANGSGEVAFYRSDALSAASDSSFLARCAVTLLGATSSTVDAVVSKVRSAAPDAVLLVVGISEIDRAAAHLHVAMVRGGGFPAGRLSSASTRRTDFVQLVDVAPTILSSLGIPVASSMIGQLWRSNAAAGDAVQVVAHLRDLDRAARHQSAAIVPFFVTESVLMVVACACAALAATGGVGPRKAAVARIGCAGIAVIPAGSFLAGLVPWWRSSSALLLLIGVTAGWVVLLTGIAFGIDAALGRRPFGLASAVGVVTVAVIGIDLVTGARLQIFTMDGYSPLVAGRFAGIGNVAFGVFGAAAVLAAGGLYERLGLRAVVTVGLIAVALDGGPPWGSDAGGVLALVPAFALLAWMLMGTRLSVTRLLAIVAGALLAVGVLGALDYARAPGRQTHLGRFVGELLHGGAWTVVRRKGVADLTLLTHSFLTLLVPVLVVVAVLLVRRPPRVLRSAFERIGVLRPTLIAVLVMAVVAAAVNDSGIAVPALAILVVLPAVASVLPAEPPADGAPDGEVSI